MTTRRRIVRDLNGYRLILTRQRLVDFEEDGSYAMNLKDFRKANVRPDGSGSVKIKNSITKIAFDVFFDGTLGEGGYIGCHNFDRKTYARILKAAGVKPKAAAAAAGR